MRRFAPKVFEIGAGGFLRAFFRDDAVDDGNGAFGGNGVARIDDFKLSLGQFFADVVGFVFKSDEYVADVALCEGGGGGASAVFKNGCVFEDGCDEFLGFLLVAVVGFQTVTVCAEEGVASVARGLGDDDVNAVFGKVVPIADLFGVVFSDKENHSAGVGCGVIGEGLLPAFFYQSFFSSRSMSEDWFMVTTSA